MLCVFYSNAYEIGVLMSLIRFGYPCCYVLWISIARLLRKEAIIFRVKVKNNSCLFFNCFSPTVNHTKFIADKPKSDNFLKKRCRRRKLRILCISIAGISLYGQISNFNVQVQNEVPFLSITNC